MIILNAFDVGGSKEYSPESCSREDDRVGDEFEVREKFMALLHGRKEEKSRTEPIKHIMEENES